MNNEVLEDDLRDLLFSSWAQYKSAPKPKPYKNRNPYTPSDAEVLQTRLDEGGVWVVVL